MNYPVLSVTRQPNARFEYEVMCQSGKSKMTLPFGIKKKDKQEAIAEAKRLAERLNGTYQP